MFRFCDRVCTLHVYEINSELENVSHKVIL